MRWLKGDFVEISEYRTKCLTVFQHFSLSLLLTFDSLVKKDLETSINAIARAELYTDTG
jgi:hypothetical protein